MFVIGLLWVASFMGHIVCSASAGVNADSYLEEAGQIYSTIFHKYNEKVHPPDMFPNPLIVNVNATFMHIRDLDIMRQEMESIIDLQIKWRDKRLAWYPYQVSNISANISTVWSPNIAYTNIAVPAKPMFNPKVNIGSNGEITWRRRETIVTTCKTQLRNNTQVCMITLGFVGSDFPETFGNGTAFTVADRFGNHMWEILDYDVDRNDEDTNVAFILTVQKKYFENGGNMEGGNCSLALQYNPNSAYVINSSVFSVFLLFLGYYCLTSFL
ncbi:acetylcholine receptor subunit beta-type acr-2-like [Gigantopelta aegis]|uniref:acetylcholine receptor subunit beta-type acr-2-like n=1 Tax=Gigantopelta aegis TaxID=1735272 RepID=UPI001B88CBD8|nr:acetylcholine receptor subunit beta-type acr-2-like [Gigantopelta aegis]